MANVLIVSLVFAPDGVSTAQIMSELAHDLKNMGHNVFVITTQPHYNRDIIAERAQPLSKIWGGALYRSSYNGISVVHTWMPRNAKRRKRRALGWLAFHVLGLAAALGALVGPTVILVPSPLLSAALIGIVVNKIKGGKYVYNVQEMYPDLAVKLGALSNPFLIKILRWLEALVYRQAAAITVISEGMKKRI